MVVSILTSKNKVIKFGRIHRTIYKTLTVLKFLSANETIYKEHGGRKTYQ